jgi:hypothetical protein
MLICLVLSDICNGGLAIAGFLIRLITARIANPSKKGFRIAYPEEQDTNLNINKPKSHTWNENSKPLKIRQLDFSCIEGFVFRTNRYFICS